MANKDFETALKNTREINITVIGRKSGRAISIPVWFTQEGDKLYLLPARGSRTEWYKNLKNNPTIQLTARGKQISTRASQLTEAPRVQTIIDEFRNRYGAGQVNSLYKVLDVVVEVPLSLV